MPEAFSCPNFNLLGGWISMNAIQSTVQQGYLYATASLPVSTSRSVR